MAQMEIAVFRMCLPSLSGEQVWLSFGALCVENRTDKLRGLS